MTVISPSLNNIVWADWFASGSSTGGIAEALAALTSGGILRLRANQTYNMSVEALYAINTNGPLVIEGGGWSTILSLTGATNKGLHLTGTAGITSPGLILRNFKIISNTTGISVAGIHIDGIAVYTLENILIAGNNKMTTGLQLTAAQQGEVSGGGIFNCTTGVLFEASAGGVRSNGIDFHGVSLGNSSKNIDITGCDDSMIHHNHLTTAPIGIDFSDASSAGINSIIANHIEQHTTAGVRISQSTSHVCGNSFYTGAGGTDLSITGGAYHVVEGNLLQGLINFGAGASHIKLLFNRMNSGAVITDASANLHKMGNHGTSSSASTFGATVLDSLAVTARETTAGDIGTFNPNAGVSGAWGIRVAGAGAAQDIYLKLGTTAVVGSTSNDAVRIMSSVGGTQWAKFNTSGSAFKRLFADQGASHVNGDWALSANWGVGATAVVAASSKDNRFRVTITAAGTPAANPTATLTFKDGTFTNAPFAVVGESGGTGAILSLTWTTTATTLVITFPGTPVAGLTYVFEGVLLG